MLVQLHIKNFITIHDCVLDFQSGCTVITGETGAGKSLLIDAILLGLGARAECSMIEPPYDKADISLIFHIQELKEATQWLIQHDLGEDAPECIIRRTIHRDGRSRSFINGSPVTLQLLRELGELLLQIHGQHEHQALLKPDVHRFLLDRYAEHTELADEVRALAEKWHALTAETEKYRQLLTDNQSRAAFLKFQLKELAELQLKPNELTELDCEHKKLAHTEDSLKNVNTVLHLLADDEENNVLKTLNAATHPVEALCEINPKAASWLESIRTAIIQLTELEDDLRQFLDSVDLNPERLRVVETRLSLLFEMGRKYKVNPAELYQMEQLLQNDHAALENHDAHLARLNVEREGVAAKYSLLATQLSKGRQVASKKLTHELTQIIHQLALPDAAFQIEFEPEKSSMTSYGLEKINFLLKTNVGQSFHPLAKILSGGELSRVGLGIHIVTADRNATPSLVFDEVDVGIGGSTASIIGQMLRQISQTHQVICITHQPQVAASGHHHLRVTKKVEENRTLSEITYLSASEKVHEIARMLGGIEMTKKTVAHAEELISNAS